MNPVMRVFTVGDAEAVVLIELPDEIRFLVRASGDVQGMRPQNFSTLGSIWADVHDESGPRWSSEAVAAIHQMIEDIEDQDPRIHAMKDVVAYVRGLITKPQPMRQEELSVAARKRLAALLTRVDLARPEPDERELDQEL